MKYYFATKKWLGLKNVLFPKVPLTVGDYDNQTIPRICVSQSIEGCLIGIGTTIFEGNEINIYLCRTSDVKQPKISQAYDTSITGEIWITKPIRIKFYNQIIITKMHSFPIHIKDYDMDIIMSEFKINNGIGLPDGFKEIDKISENNYNNFNKNVLR